MDSVYPVPVPDLLVKTKGASSEEYALGTGNSQRDFSSSEPGGHNGSSPTEPGSDELPPIAAGSSPLRGCRVGMVDTKPSVRASGGTASDHRLHALCCQAFDLRGTGYLRDACDAIVVEWHRRHLVELLKETA